MISSGFFVLSASFGYMLARRANSFNHWGNGVVGLCILSLAWMAARVPSVPSEYVNAAGLSLEERNQVQGIAQTLAQHRKGAEYGIGRHVHEVPRGLDYTGQGELEAGTSGTGTSGAVAGTVREP